MPDVLMLLMRHSDIDTTMKYYVGRNARKAAEVIWEAEANSLYNPLYSHDSGQ